MLLFKEHLMTSWTVITVISFFKWFLILCFTRNIWAAESGLVTGQMWSSLVYSNDQNFSGGLVWPQAVLGWCCCVWGPQSHDVLVCFRRWRWSTTSYDWHTATLPPTQTTPVSSPPLRFIVTFMFTSTVKIEPCGVFQTGSSDEGHPAVCASEPPTLNSDVVQWQDLHVWVSLMSADDVFIISRTVPL